MAYSFRVVICAAVLLILASVVEARDHWQNDVLGTSQWEEPNEPYRHDGEDGKYWFDPTKGESSWEFPGPWTAAKSKEHQGRAYYHNKETGESTWDMPAVMGWRRISSSEEL
ncbi:hypothetical protein CYMTET_56298 [Cymbomonas tetramitiformis]|uniref:WW domain-containing protein n=1 Tax=Cymbomonas tetramitiformis TaxID=36881 RepID=A0AAE0ENX2_9CHLO|nr:hypothetical protein CYMTET_56298 [Cymbomonas tetramitiformis]